MVTVVSHIPLPAPKPPRSKWPFGTMNVGDSFYTDRPLAQMTSTAHIYGGRHNRKFTARREGGGVRVWRIA